MVSETTIIPQEIKVDGVTIDKNGLAELQIKQSSGNPIIKDIALNELNITVLEVNASLSSVNDDFVENFIDADGVLNTVDTGNTTAIFNTDIYANGSTISYGNSNIYNAETTSYVSVYTISTLNKKIIEVTNTLRGNTSSTGYCYMKFNYTDASSEDSIVNSQPSTIYTPKTYPNPNPSKTVTSIEVMFKSLGGQTSYCDENYAETDIIPEIKDIYLNYNKANPTKTLLSCFSDDTGKADVGSYTYELVHIGTAETTGELNPDIENTISMTNTPDRMIIHQKDTAVSKIKKFVLAVWE